MLEYNRANHAKKMESKSRKKLLLGGYYFSSLKSSAERERYLEKLKHVGGLYLHGNRDFSYHSNNTVFSHY